MLWGVESSFEGAVSDERSSSAVEVISDCLDKSQPRPYNIIFK